MILNTELKIARQGACLTQAQIAKKAHVTERAYQNYEYGKREPDVRTAIQIADSLGVTEFESFKRLFGAATPDNTKEPDGNQAEK